jgi:hypothetical protein
LQTSALAVGYLRMGWWLFSKDKLEEAFTGMLALIGWLLRRLCELEGRIKYLPGTTGWGRLFAGRPTVLWNPAAMFRVNPANVSYD